MTNFKNHDGFTLIEAMLAITIAALVLTPVFILQGTVLQSIMRLSHRIERLFLAQQFLYEARSIKPEAREFSLDKKIEEPQTILKYTMTSVPKKSQLANVPGLRIERVTVKWQDQGIERQDRLISFVYKPEQKK